MTHTWSGIISAHIQGSTDIVRGDAPMFALITPPFLRGQLNKQNYNYAAACSTNFGFHRKRLIHNWVWRLTLGEGVLYCMDAAQNKCEVYV